MRPAANAFTFVREQRSRRPSVAAFRRRSPESLEPPTPDGVERYGIVVLSKRDHDAKPERRVRKDMRTRPVRVTDRQGLAEKVAFLRRPDAYPGRVPDVEDIETHMAWVFLAGEFAYKLKKPVRYPFLDFSTLEARRADCEEEVRLNRRLAPDVYLGTLPLTRSGAGLALGGDGKIVEWLVKMRRLSRLRMLDEAIRRGTLRRSDAEGASELLAAFYARGSPVPLNPAEYVRRLRDDLEENARELVACSPKAEGDRARRVARALAALVDAEAPLLRQRVRDGRILDAHGDLRPEHVFLGPPPAVIDCLEFNRDFRTLDPADELAFLGLECERLGAPELGSVFLEAYGRRTGDRPPRRLVELHAAHRALLRAKIAIWHLRDEDLGAEPDRWVARCGSYLALAAAHLRTITEGVD